MSSRQQYAIGGGRDACDSPRADVLWASSMMRSLAASLLIAACCLVALDARAEGTKEVEGLLVVPGPGPSVQSTYPAAKATAPYGVIILKIVFDQPMTPDAWAYGRAPGGDFPDCLEDPRLLSDKRTFVLLCNVAANRTYAIQINPAPRFASLNGRSARPYTLTFSTSGVITRALHDALQQAGLTDNDDPVMTWRDKGQGVSETAAAP